MAKKDHKVEMITSNGDRVTQHVDAKEARRLEDEPFRDGSNIDMVTVHKK